MSEGVEAYNLLPDPKPTDTGDWVRIAPSDMMVQMLSDNRLHITNRTAGSDRYIYTRVNLPAGTYRYGAEVSSPQGAYPQNLLRVVIPPRNELSPATWDGTAGRVVTPPNVLPEDGELELRVMVGPNANCAVWVRHLFVMSEEDYQQMLSSNITWFDGDGIVRGGGFLLTACIHMWIAALLWWWSHEPAHHAARRAAGHWLQKLCAHAETGINDRPACGGRAGIGRGRTPRRCATQPVHKGRDHEHGHTIAPVGVRSGHGGRGYHARPIQAGVPAGHGQDRHIRVHGHIQHGRRMVQTVAFRGHAARRDGRIPCDPEIQPVLPVSHALPRLGVAA